LDAQLQELPTAKDHEIRTDDSGEKIWISYPSAIESSDPYLKTEVLIELGGRNVIDPNERHSITADAAAVTTGVSYPSCEVTVLSLKRTFWEKATLIHVECNRDQLKESAERLSRHWYDLIFISAHDLGKLAMQDRRLFEDVVRHKAVFFNTAYANYDACLDGNLKLLPDGASRTMLQADYEKMVSAGMLYGESPAFEDIVKSVQEIQGSINTQ